MKELTPEILSIFTFYFNVCMCVQVPHVTCSTIKVRSEDVSAPGRSVLSVSGLPLHGAIWKLLVFGFSLNFFKLKINFAPIIIMYDLLPFLSVTSLPLEFPPLFLLKNLTRCISITLPVGRFLTLRLVVEWPKEVQGPGCRDVALDFSQFYRALSRWIAANFLYC